MKQNLLALALIICCAVTAAAQNFLDKYLTDPLTYTTIANSSNAILSPRDLDFKPGTNELWVVNYGDVDGGTNVIIFNAGLSNQTSQYRKDTHTAHFMGYPSAIAFNDEGNWGSSGEIFSTCGSNCTFMGPSLWSGDTNIFARVFQNNWLSNYPLGSHLDMLHQSPYAMGIASDSANAFWVFDGHNGNLCRYDFSIDHGPGHDDHSDGKIRRYTDVLLTREINVPGHMAKDKATGWLYIADNGNNRVIRVNTLTGTLGADLIPPSTGYENLAEYKAVTGAVRQTVDSFSTRPCGIDVYNGRLIIGDYDNGNIRIYDITGVNPVYLGMIATGQAGIEGVKIGPDGKIWFVNNTQNTVVRINPLPVVDDASILNIISPVSENYEPNFFSPYFDNCVSSVSPSVTLLNNGSNTLTSVTINYSVDGLPYPPFPWSGSLAAGATATVNPFGFTTTAGNHKIVVWTSNPNGTADRNPANDSKSGSFRVMNPVSSLPFSETFSTATFPPTGWSNIHFNPDNGMARIANVGGFGNNTGCLKMDIWNTPIYITTQKDYLITPRIDLSNSAATKLIFSVAYARYDNSTNDTLKVFISTDCGASWTTIYNKAGATLSTAPNVTSAFTPTANQWRSDSISLTPYMGQPDVLFMFMTVANDGNNIYIDDIQIPAIPTAVPQNALADEIKVYPNPGNGNFTVELASLPNPEAAIDVYNMFGQKIIAGYKTNFSSGKLNLDFNELSTGNYFMEIKTSAGMFYSKLSVIK